MADVVGSPEWFRNLLNKVKKEAGENWAHDLAKEMLEEERKALLEALQSQEG